MRPSSFAPVAACLVSAVACQTYDFVPVAPLSVSQEESSTPIVVRKFKPNVMVLVDKSGSMDLPATPSLPACTRNGALCGSGDTAKTNPCNVTTCPTRWSELNLALDPFLQAQAQTVRFGLAFFPGARDGGGPAQLRSHHRRPGGPPGDPDDDSPTTLSALSDAARLALSRVKSQNPPGPDGTGGATPTGPSLQFFSTYAPLLNPSRLDLVVLLTDGLPNCNGARLGCELRVHRQRGPLSAPGVHQLRLSGQGPDGAGGAGPRLARCPPRGHRLRGRDARHPRRRRRRVHRAPGFCRSPERTRGAVRVRSTISRAGRETRVRAGCASGSTTRRRTAPGSVRRSRTSPPTWTGNPACGRSPPHPTSEDLVLLTLNGTRYSPGDTDLALRPAGAGRACHPLSRVPLHRHRERHHAEPGAARPAHPPRALSVPSSRARGRSAVGDVGALRKWGC